MRIPFFDMFMTSPFEGLQEHAEKVEECSWAFQQAIECHFSPKCKTFEEFRAEVIQTGKRSRCHQTSYSWAYSKKNHDTRIHFFDIQVFKTTGRCS